MVGGTRLQQSQKPNVLGQEKGSKRRAPSCGSRKEGRFSFAHRNFSGHRRGRPPTCRVSRVSSRLGGPVGACWLSRRRLLLGHARRPRRRHHHPYCRRHPQQHRQSRPRLLGLQRRLPSLARMRYPAKSASYICQRSSLCHGLAICAVATSQAIQLVVPPPISPTVIAILPATTRTPGFSTLIPPIRRILRMEEGNSL